MEDVNRIIARTLFAVQNNVQGSTILLKKVDENVDALVKLNLVKKLESSQGGKAMTMLETTDLGRAAFKGISLSASEGKARVNSRKVEF